MRILYIFVLLLLFFVVIFCIKTGEKKSFVVSSVFYANIIYFSNLFLTFILSFLHIPSNVIVLSFINIIVVAFLLFFNKKKYGKMNFQKYELNVRELCGIGVIFIACLVICFLRFDGFRQITYETTDPALHYRMSSAYSNTLQLFDNANSKDYVYGGFSHTMPGFYVNCGFLMYIFDNIPSYKVYLIFDMLLLFFLACTFYVTILKIKKVKNNNFISLIISFLYLGAYALNNLIFGFGYLGVGILAVNLIFLIWLYIDETKQIKLRKRYYFLLFVANFGLFFSYYLFIPVVYLAQGLYIIYKYFKKKYLLSECLFCGLFTLICPFTIGIIYFVLPGLIQTGNTVLDSAYSNEGYIYRDLWSNFVLLMPILVFSCVYFTKKKKMDFVTLLFIIEFLFIIITFCFGLFFGKVSSYYYFKSYYIFYLIFYLMIVRLINVEDSNVSMFFKINIYFVLFIVCILLSNVENRIQNKNILFNNANVTSTIANIYWFNSTKIIHNNAIFNALEMKIIYESNNYKDVCLNEKNEFFVVGDTLQKLWFYSLTDIIPIHNFEKNNSSMFYDENDVKSFESDNDSKCVIVFNRFNDEDSDDYVDERNYRILYKNDYGKILMKDS